MVVGPPNSVASIFNQHRSIVHGHQLEHDVFAAAYIGDGPAEAIKGESSGPGLNGAGKDHTEGVGDGNGGVEGGKPSDKKNIVLIARHVWGWRGWANQLSAKQTRLSFVVRLFSPRPMPASMRTVQPVLRLLAKREANSDRAIRTIPSCKPQK